MQQNRKTSEEEYKNIFEAASDGLIIHDMNKRQVVEANAAACKMHGYTRQEFIGLSSSAFMPADSYKQFLEHIQSAQNGGEFESLVIHTRKDGTPFHTEVRRSIIDFRGQQCLLSVIRDVSQRIQTEKVLGDEIEARMREQVILLAISHTLASTLELQPELILDQLREIIEYRHAGLFSFEGSQLVTLAMRGTTQVERSLPIIIRVDNPEHLVDLFNGHRPIRIADIWSDEPQAQFLRSFLNDGAAILLEGMHSWMWVPLAVKGRIIGGIGVAHEERNYFNPHQADLALSVANQAAITMINAELYGHAQAIAVLEERQRLARNLHDAINQSLFSAGLIAEVLPRLWERDQVEARRSLQDLRRLTRGAQAEMRALLAELRPTTLTDSNLGELLTLLGNAHSGRTNIPVEVTVTGEFIPPAEVQIAFYRVCQEALYNIAKHAKASRVVIDLRQSEEMLNLRIQDNGQGFEPTHQFSGHYGMSIMRERAESVKAELSVVSQPGQGTEISIHWKNPDKKESL
ncbi:MAG: PAS domain S-box protein [Anaerolineales bacterium]|nr:PAS domain S-box protein [Anaerolineales bacterium]